MLGHTALSTHTRLVFSGRYRVTGMASCFTRFISYRKSLADHERPIQIGDWTTGIVEIWMMSLGQSYIDKLMNSVIEIN